MGSIFKNWASLSPGKSTIDSRGLDSVQVCFGQVLETNYDDPSSLGSIKVKIYGVNESAPEESIFTSAEPADRNLVKYPVPGEIVLLTAGLNDYQVNGKTAKTYYYTTVLSTSGNTTYNGNPYYLNRLNTSAVAAPELKQRFDAAIISRDAFFNVGEVKARPILKPYEGDFIIQSRFGSNLRFGSLGFEEKNNWSAKSGLSGDPILMITANTTTGTQTAEEDINEDDSSIYLCSSQNIPAILSTSKSIKSLGYIYNVTRGKIIVNETGDSTAFIKPTIIPPPNLLVYGGNADPSAYTTGQPDIDLAMQLLLAREGTILQSMWDVNKWRTGHGSDKITLGTGKIIDLYSEDYIHNPNTPTLLYNGNSEWWPWTWRDKDQGILDFLYMGNIVKTTAATLDNGSKMWKIEYALDKEDKFPDVKAFFNNKLSALAERGSDKYADKKIFSNRPEYQMTLRDIFKEKTFITLITKEEAAADKVRRMTTGFFPGAATEVGNPAAWESIGIGGRAALVSIKYNYGNISSAGSHGSPTIAQVAALGNKYSLALRISRMTNGSQDRHQVEAYVCAFDSMPPSGFNSKGDAAASALQQQIITTAAGYGLQLV